MAVRRRVRRQLLPQSWELQLTPGSLVIGGLILWFALVHLRIWLAQPGVFVGLGQVILELIQGFLLVIHRRDRAGRQPLQVWAATTIGSWGFLLARPGAGAYFDAPLLFATQPLFGSDGLWLILQVSGTVLAIASLLYLGRSFGLLAANRGVRTGGLYHLVRHPAYASYTIVQLGYLLENLSFWNLSLFMLVLVAQLTRIRQEERTLTQDPVYRSYCRHVRFRLVPGLY